MAAGICTINFKKAYHLLCFIVNAAQPLGLLFFRSGLLGPIPMLALAQMPPMQASQVSLTFCLL